MDVDKNIILQKRKEGQFVEKKTNLKRVTTLKKLLFFKVLETKNLQHFSPLPPFFFSVYRHDKLWWPLKPKLNYVFIK